MQIALSYLLFFLCIIKFTLNNFFDNPNKIGATMENWQQPPGQALSKSSHNRLWISEVTRRQASQ